MSFPEVGLVVLQSVLAVAIGWTVGTIALERFIDDESIGLPERALAAVAGFAVASIVLMVLHVVTGGAAFGNAYVVPVFGVLVLAMGYRRGVWRVSVPWKPVLLVVLVLVGLYVVPMFIVGSTVREGDPPWHMGWTHELLAGQPLPDGPAPDFARNAYPWGWHAILATSTRLVPGSTPLLAHEALHILLVLAIPLAAACLARRVRRDAGWFAAAAAALIGGFGWVSALEFDFVASPTEARYGADMVVASPNSVYELFPPALPREMGLVLLGAAGVAVLLAIRRGRAAHWVAAGVLAGCAGLVSFPMLIPALLWATVGAFLSTPGKRLVNWLRTVVPALALFGLWLGPLVYWYITEGGFVDIVPVLGVEWPVITALASWGLLLPLSLLGVYLLLRERSTEAKVVIGFTCASVLLLIVAIARRELGWTIQGNQTLLHQGRMWPVAHLLGAALGGIALAYLYQTLRARDSRFATTLLAAILALGSTSLILSSAGLTSLIAGNHKGFVYGDEDIDSGSFAREAAGHLSPRDVVVVDDDNGLAFKLFEFSGVSLGNHDDPRLEGNEVRIRYRDLAERYMERMENGGFEATHQVVPEGSPAAGEVLARGEYQGRSWSLIRVDR